MAAMLQASRMPALMNIGRLVYTRVFNAHVMPQPGPAAISVSDECQGVVPLVGEAVTAAGGFEIPARGAPGVPVSSGTADAPASVLPHSLRTLIVNKIPVKPERLLALRWDRILEAGGHLDAEHRAAAQNEVTRLTALNRQGMKIDPQTALEIFRRFTTLTDLVNLGELLARQPQSRGDVYQENVDLYVKDVDLLERMRDKVNACFKRGDYEQAQRLADRAVQKSGHLCALLDTLRQRLTDAEEKSLARLQQRLSTVGGFVVLAVGASYMGYSATLPSLPGDVLAGTADAAALGTVVCLLATTAEWLRTPDFATHLNRVQNLQFQRTKLRNEIDTLACEALMEASSTPPASISGMDSDEDDDDSLYVAM